MDAERMLSDLLAAKYRGGYDTVLHETTQFMAKHGLDLEEILRAAQAACRHARIEALLCGS